jgi:hypothetical protein
LRQRARDGFDSQTEIVGNVLPRHRQLDIIPGMDAIGHFQQKTGDALARRLDEQQDMALDAIELESGQCPELPGDVVVARGKRHHRAALDDENLRVGDRLGGEGMLGSGLEAEKIARQIEVADLAATVIEHLVGAHRSTEHLVEKIGGLVLTVDFGVARERHRGAHQFDGARQGRGSG